MSARPKLLDLFCSAGGAGVGYARAGFEVHGVDIVPQPNYPFEFTLGDALTELQAWDIGEAFDAVHASPPCQAYSAMKVMPNAREHPDLVAPTRALLEATGLPYVIENVPGAPVKVGQPDLFTEVGGITLCGSMFQLNDGVHELRRHRLFESNVPLVQPRCNHRLPVIGFYGDHARTRRRTIDGNRDRGGDITGLARKMPLVRDLMGIDWMTWGEAVLSIPPAYTEFIGTQLIAHLEERAA